MTVEVKDGVEAAPAKRFFVEMLTRDIELQDAILDLLDNCVDGAIRSNQITPPKNPEKPYAGYYASIVFNKDKFSITDNCGGIPLDLAKEYAFRLGRPDVERDKDIPTVGMYGIGMKRAIFKMGRSSQISSQNNNDSFSVSISSEWLDDDQNWKLPIQTGVEDLALNSTSIEVSTLHEQISKLFTDKSDFLDTFAKSVTAHYSYIIDKGFSVTVNEIPIESKAVNLMYDPTTLKGEGIAPYLYQGSIQNVDVDLAVGLYRPIPTEEESEAEQEGRNTKENAGWTIICNDRVVVYCDKTRLTGWGEAGVPSYHSQFIAIAGTVIFKSNAAANLPVTTTKRGIDGNSEVYLAVKDIMRDGLKHFTSFTNKWKSNSTERQELQNRSKSVEIAKASLNIPNDAWKAVKGELEGKRFVPNLPTPKVENPTKQIRFSRSTKEIELVAEYLFDDKSAAPASVGEACFNTILKKAVE